MSWSKLAEDTKSRKRRFVRKEYINVYKNMLQYREEEGDIDNENNQDNVDDPRIIKLMEMEEDLSVEDLVRYRLLADAELEVERANVQSDKVVDSGNNSHDKSTLSFLSAFRPSIDGTATAKDVEVWVVCVVNFI